MLRLVGTVGSAHGLSAERTAQLLVVHLKLVLRARRGMSIVSGTSMSTNNINAQIESLI